jgi:hypothetical protein
MTDAQKALLRKVLRMDTDRPVTAEEVERLLRRVEGVVVKGRAFRAIGKNEKGETLWELVSVQ